MRKKTYVSHLGLMIFAGMLIIPGLNLFCWIPLLVFRQSVPTFDGISAGQAIHNFLKRKTYVSKTGWYIFTFMIIIPGINLFCWIPLLICQQNEPPNWGSSSNAEYVDNYGSYWDSGDSGD